MKIEGMRKHTKPGGIRAFFNVEHGGFLMKDFKLMENEKGLWISFPKRSYTQNNETKWATVVELANPGSEEGKKLMDLISALARDEYLGAK